MEKYFNNKSIVLILWKWKWHLGVVVVAAVLLAALFSSSLFITPKFSSKAIIYPSNVAPYSEESETEQLLQWLQARDIKDSMIQKFDLGKHYEIGKDYEHYYSTLLYEYSQNVSITKTQYESIEIEVLDKDPQQAKDMVETLIELVNNKIRRIQRAKYEEVVEINKRLMHEKEKEIDSVRSIIQNLGKNYGIIDVENQAQEVTEGYLRTVDGNASRINTQGVNRLKSNLEEKGGEFLVYRAYIVNLMTRYNEIKAQYEQAYKDVNKQFTFTNTVTAPFVSDKKAYPVRWLIVLYTVVAALILSLVVIAIIENKRSMELFKEES